ncbi:MAG TPA: hypothetical protein VLA66_09695 [Thermoanaerobaculia bacterium]|nr:hypothetical protein [Thermoanaerobaculia bacterium]
MNSPDYEFLSAPLPVVTALHLITLTLHFAAMGTLFGGLGALLLARVPDRHARPGARRLVRLLPSLMAATVTLGVAPLLFLQLVYHRQAYAAAIASAWLWLAVPAAAMAAYFLLYAGAGRPGDPNGAQPLGAGSWIAFGLLAFVALVYSSVFTLAETPGALAATWSANASGFAINPDFARWVPRWLHMVTGALAVGSFALAAFGRDDEKLFPAARGLYLWSMIAAMLLGVATLAGLGDGIAPYMRSAAVWWMLVSLALALGSLHLLFRKKLVASGALLFVSLFAMVVNRHLARLVALDGALDPSTLPVRPQWGVFALFLLCFVAMLAVGGWMLRLYFSARAETPAH